MKAGRLILAFFCVVLGVRPIHAKDGNCTALDASSRPDCPRAIAFFEQMQEALRGDDRDKVASLVHFPLRVNSKKKTVIHNPAELKERFDEIFDSGVRCSILGAQKADVWGNWQGFTVNDGAVWFDAVMPANEKIDVKAKDYWEKYPLKVVTVNNGAHYPCSAR